jgi:FHA domain
MDMLQFLEQHDRVKQLLLEGETSAGLEAHVAACVVCAPLAAKLAEIDRLIRDVPEPRPELLRNILRAGGTSPGPADAVRRVEMLWPAVTHGESARRDRTLLPLVLAVDADRYPPDDPPSRRTERYIFVGRYPITIGRGPDMDVPIWDRSVSRRHAQMDWRDDAWVIRDMESTNGTKVNGARLSSSEITHLKPGDEIEMGLYARVTVRTFLPALDPAGVMGEIHRLLAWAADPGQVRVRDETQREDLRARLVGLREETVRLRAQVSQMARRGVDAEAFPIVYERLTNMLALIEHEGL